MRAEFTLHVIGSQEFSLAAQALVAAANKGVCITAIGYAQLPEADDSGPVKGMVEAPDFKSGGTALSSAAMRVARQKGVGPLGPT